MSARPRGVATACAFLVLALAGRAAFAAIEAKATLEPEVIGVGETATLTIEVTGGALDPLRFTPGFTLENLQIVGRSSETQSMTFVNGAVSRSYRVSWQVRPQTTGAARVRSVTVRLGDQVQRLPGCEIQVQEAPTGANEGRDPADLFEQLFGGFPGRPGGRRRQPPPQAAELGPAAFLRTEIEPPQPFAGQQALYTLYLYTRQDVSSISPNALPSFRGFWVRDVPMPQNLPTEMVTMEGQRYARVALLQKALFPLRPGRHELEPAKIDVLMQRYLPTAFGPPIAQPEQVSLHTPATVIDVRPLPPPVAAAAGTTPASVAVGRLALAARLDPPRLRIGEAATLTLTLSGAGNLQGVAPPQLHLPTGLTAYPPQQQGSDRFAGTALVGQRTFRYVVQPNRAGRYHLELPGVPYFDPAAHEYRTASATPLELDALPRAPEAQTASTAPGAPHPIRAEVAPVAAPSLASRLAGLSWSALLALFTLPWGVALAALWLRRHPAGPREKRGAARTTEARLAAAAVEERPRQAAVQFEEAWRDFLTARWGLPAGTPAAHWTELLLARGARPEAVGGLGQLAQDLRYLREAPQLSATDTLRDEVLAQSRRLLQKLR